ncbi:hypothetical protein BOC51_31300 [Burkholderia pseudomallei]|nr:hypothetical protein BOC43_10320 [Burkholderia pseudomallei]ARL54120.1 hypothetical protein BOC51_31300 [Burkholderia pseudomallei]
MRNAAGAPWFASRADHRPEQRRLAVAMLARVLETPRKTTETGGTAGRVIPQASEPSHARSMQTNQAGICARATHTARA